jgi:hypothetical protein
LAENATSIIPSDLYLDLSPRQTVVLIVVGTAWLGPWTNAMTAISATERLQALQNPLYVWDRNTLIFGAIAQTISLLAIIAVSVLKPWGRRKIHLQDEMTVANK